MKHTKSLSIISGEELLSAKFDLRQIHEEKVLADLKRYNYKFIKWEWITQDIPNTHVELIVTYEDNKK